MIVTDEERKIIARDIRENYACDGLGYKIVNPRNIALAIGLCPGPLLHDVDFWCRLADLIEPEPERTCEWVWGEEWVDTPAGPCELAWAHWYLDCGCWHGEDPELSDLSDKDERPTMWLYCPKCGKRVVNDAD